MISQAAVDDAMQAADNGDTRPLTAVLPAIVCHNGATLAAHVAQNAPDRARCLPELLTLFNTLGGHEHLSALIGAAFAQKPRAQHDRIVYACARIGTYGFSFPKWRYLTQSFDGASLVERFGMTRLKRDTDTRDPRLPDPHRDELGAGFMWSDRDWYIEYRRAYLVVAEKTDYDPVTLVIRNNSYFFGRDRLPSAVYVSWKNHHDTALRALDAQTLAQDFETLDSFRTPVNVLPDYSKFLRINRALDRLDAFDSALHAWLWNDGKEHLAAFLQTRLQGQVPYVAKMTAHTPPWFTRALQPASPELASSGALACAFNSLKTPASLILTTGRRGDFPVKPRLR